MSRSKSLSNNKGFTLVEVLAATAILVMVCVLVLKISTQILDSWGDASKRLSRETEVDLALDVMEEDLETAFPHFWLYDGKDKEGVKKGTRLCFYSQGRGGEWSALAYQVGYDEKRKRYGLYRYSMVEKKSIRDRVDLGGLISPQQIPSEKIVASPNLLAKNVLDFSIKFLYRDGKGNAQWTSETSAIGIPSCADVYIIMSDNYQIARRVTFMVEERL